MKALMMEDMMLRDYFATHAPTPTKTAITRCVELDALRNPNNDNYKPRRRSIQEIRTWLRYKWADEMLRSRELPTED